MTTRSGLVTKISVIFLIFGTALFSSGAYVFDEECQNGMGLEIEKVDDSNNGNVDGNTTDFEDLSPMEQRIFLEAYTDQPGFSNVHANWSVEWFNTDSYASLYVDYRGELFETSLWANDCGLPVGEFFQSIGVLLGAIGGIGRTGVWLLSVARTAVR